MKILQLANKIPYPPKDGGAIATLNIAKGLAERGHEVTILGMNTSKHYFDLNLLPESLKNKIIFRDVKIDTGLSIFSGLLNLLFSGYPYNAVRFFNHKFEEALKRILQENEFDIIQLEGLYLMYYIDIIRQNSNARVAFRAHNIEHEIWERSALQERSILKKYYLKVLSKRIKNFKLKILNKYDILIPITKRDENQFLIFGNKMPTIVIPVGTDVEKDISAADEINFPGVFFIGTLDWFPNQEGLIWFLEQVWPKVIAIVPDITFHVAGRNAPPWLASRLKNSPNTHFYGEIDNAREFIDQNALMIAPLFSGSGMRVKIIEGMARAKAILTTQIGAEGIDVENGRHILIENNDTDFAAQIVELMRNKSRYISIGKNAREFVEHNYDNQKIVQNLEAFYMKNIS